MRKEIGQGERIPAWYGVAWRDYASRLAICYPIPFNVVIAWAYLIKVWLKQGSRAVEAEPRIAFDQGFDKGYQTALKSGVKQ